jgi:hypothetical protein
VPWSRIRIASASSCAGTSPASTQPGAAPTGSCIESTRSSAKSWYSASNTDEMLPTRMNAHVALRAFEDDHRAGAKASVTTPGVWGGGFTVGVTV